MASVAPSADPDNKVDLVYGHVAYLAHVNISIHIMPLPIVFQAVATTLSEATVPRKTKNMHKIMAATSRQMPRGDFAGPVE